MKEVTEEFERFHQSLEGLKEVMDRRTAEENAEIEKLKEETK